MVISSKHEYFLILNLGYNDQLNWLLWRGNTIISLLLSPFTCLIILYYQNINPLPQTVVHKQFSESCSYIHFLKFFLDNKV